ncbi:MAG: hypothetical protein B7Z72_00080 [Gemmatimonadetes bacterium 21-71-4]|nr:MAG: hypothetical protein B7Z72_00080 [Gemmatimonadetes bacterium 21-71-4]
MIGRFKTLALTLALAVAAAPMQAQGPARAGLFLELPTLAPSVQVAQAATVGPVLQSAAVGFQSLGQRVALEPTPALYGAPPMQSRAMMIVGGAGLIVGALIGGTPGTIVMVGSGVLGLFGLYYYLQ